MLFSDAEAPPPQGHSRTRISRWHQRETPHPTARCLTVPRRARPLRIVPDQRIPECSTRSSLRRRTGGGTRGDAGQAHRSGARAGRLPHGEDLPQVPRLLAASREALRLGHRRLLTPTPAPWAEAFHEACVIHDFGYRNYGGQGLRLDPTEARRKIIDDRLYEEMLWICSDRPEALLNCPGAARTMYQAVRQYGGPAFYDE